MSLLDFFTGGKNNAAEDALKRAEQYFSAVNVPTVQQLTLPELQKYVEAGIMTPAEAQAYLQQNNAYADQNINQAGTAAQIQALNQLAEVANAGESGTPLEQAAMDMAEQNMNRAVGGQRGAIENAMAARGTPYALIQAALENQTVGQEGQQAHMDAINAQAQAYQTALNALAQSGQVGNALQGQQNTQANQVAAAQNAMQQFNAQNQQQAAEANAARTQEANAMNAANKQQVANNNTGLANTRTQYNAGLPQQVFQDQMSKAEGQAGAATNIGNLYQKEGQQNAGLFAGLINTATSFVPKPGGAGATGFTPQNPTEAAFNTQYKTNGYAHGGYVDHDHSICMAHGGYCLADGGRVPGEAPFPGDTEANDVIDAHLSPGEAVISRSAVAAHPDTVGMLLGDQGQQTELIDSNDVATLLKALRAIRMGGVA